MMFFSEGQTYLRVSDEDWAEYRAALTLAAAERDEADDDPS